MAGIDPLEHPSAPLGPGADLGPATAVVVGAHGGIGLALTQALQAQGRWRLVLGLGRRSQPALDLTDEASIAAAAAQVQADAARAGAPLRLAINAAGWLHGEGRQPEKSWQNLDAASLHQSFALNAIGPALLMKHFLPLLPREGRSVLACLSARVGSIGDNRLGGWYGYRASKAALNQLVHTAAIELRRRQPQALCVALHPGTVDTALSAPFARSGLAVQTPAECAERLLQVIDGLQPEQSGGFFDHHGLAVPW
ncbi:SDR family NAD(P)-dependent oxidoreductase [Ideonella sp.]|uniref:SDR family NAD(P)-dependent oxidoreductase n=1 Tax=Ideonella sp. TaxID=1929293 RepID=UPI003BB689AE